MTNEQREAIGRLNIHSEYAGLSNGAVVVNKADLDTVSSLIKEQQEEIEKYKTLYDRALSDVVKADKQIDLMAEIFYKKFKAELLLEYGFEGEEQLKQYFKEIAEQSSNIN